MRASSSDEYDIELNSDVLGDDYANDSDQDMSHDKSANSGKQKSAAQPPKIQYKKKPMMTRASRRVAAEQGKNEANLYDGSAIEEVSDSEMEKNKTRKGSARKTPSKTP